MQKLLPFIIAVTVLSACGPKTDPGLATLYNDIDKQAGYQLENTDSTSGMRPLLAKLQTYNTTMAADTTWQYYLAMAYCGSDSFNQAEAIFTQLLQNKKNGDTTVMYFYRSRVRKRMKDYPGALADMTRFLNSTPADSKLYRYGLLRRALIYIVTNNHQLAIKDYTTLIELDPLTAKYYLLRGFVYTELLENDKACPDFKKAHELGDRGGQSGIDLFCK